VNESWRTVADKIDALSLRERALVLLSVVAVLYLLWDFLLYQPVYQSRASVMTDLRTVEQRITAMEQEEAILIQTLGSEPDRDLKLHMADLENRMAALDANLSELSVGLVPVDKLAAILQDVLAKTETLQLQSLQTLPVEKLALNVKTDADAASAGVYKHTVAITVKGSYFQVLDYLKKLEAMTWRFYWDELRYQQDNYPNGLFEIRVYTLSTDEGFFGV
jgi:MSHA biogenesis protein MshJ